MHYADELVITFKLDTIYIIDTVLVIGEFDNDDTHMLVGGFEVHIGLDSDHKNNKKCSDGPYLSCSSCPSFDRYHW